MLVPVHGQQSVGGSTGWTHQDVGSVGVPGSASYDAATDTFTVAGSGSDIWGNSDSFQFVHQAVAGDGVLTVCVTSQANTDGWAKAGLMIRGGLNPDAQEASVALTPSNGVTFQSRTSTSGSTATVTHNNLQAPRWLRLERRGTIVAAYDSADGSHWNFVGSDTFGFNGTTEAGLAVCSHNNTLTSNVSFQGMQVYVGAAASLLPAPWMPDDVGGNTVLGDDSYASGVFTLQSLGNGIGDTSDQFHFACQMLTGDGVLTARLVQQDNAPYPGADSGIMLRESLAPDARHVYVGVSPQWGGFFKYRTAVSGSTGVLNPQGVGAPQWLKLERRGSQFLTSVSADGYAWQFLGVQSLDLAATIYAGLATASHNSTNTIVATFDSVSLTPGQSATSQLPTPWQSNDIGNVGVTGLTDYQNGSFTVRGSGGDINGTIDAFRFVYQSMRGDGQIIIRVASQDHPTPWAKAGITIRESLDPASRSVGLFLTPYDGTYFQYRTDPLTSTYRESLASALTPPRWLRLDRYGRWVHAYESADGKSWNYIDSTELQTGSNVYVGMGVCSCTTDQVSTATFDQVSLQTEGTPMGLIGTYFSDTTLTNPQVSEVDAIVNFAWDNGVPNTIIGAQPFAVRWQGQVEPRYSETYTFSTVSDDGARLWVDGQLIIDHWVPHSPYEDRSTPVTLQAGQRYDIKLEYYNGLYNGVVSGGRISLSWQSASQPKTIIPATQLFPVLNVGGGQDQTQDIAVEALTPQVGCVVIPADDGVSAASTNGGASTTAANSSAAQGGVLTQIEIPLSKKGMAGKAALKIQYGAEAAGEVVWVQPLHGGTCTVPNAPEYSATRTQGFFVTLDESGSATFQYQPPNSGGNYKVLTRLLHVSTVFSFSVRP